MTGEPRVALFGKGSRGRTGTGFYGGARVEFMCGQSETEGYGYT